MPSFHASNIRSKHIRQHLTSNLQIIVISSSSHNYFYVNILYRTKVIWQSFVWAHLQFKSPYAFSRQYRIRGCELNLSQKYYFTPYICDNKHNRSTILTLININGIYSIKVHLLHEITTYLKAHLV